MRRSPQMRQKIFVTVANNALICRNDKTFGRIKTARQIFVSNKARPIAFVGCSVVWHRTVARAPNRDFSAIVKTDIAFDIGINKILRRAAVSFECGIKIVPILGAIQ